MLQIILSLMELFRDNEQITQMEHNMHPNWYDTNQLAILQAWPRI